MSIKQTKHTPRPWSVNRWGFKNEAVEILGPQGQTIADLAEKEESEAPPVGLDEMLANAAFIVRACNIHGDLVAACAALLGEEGGNPPHGTAGHIDLADAVKMARAALCKARA